MRPPDANCPAPVVPRRQKKQLRKNPDDIEAVFHHEPSKLLVEELCHMTCCQGVIDLTCGAGVWALVCMENRIPYLGVVLSAVHLEELRTHLVNEAPRSHGTMLEIFSHPFHLA